MNRKIEKHGEFVAQPGDRLLVRYTDGGPGLRRTQRQPASTLGTGGQFARRVRRNRAARKVAA